MSVEVATEYGRRAIEINGAFACYVVRLVDGWYDLREKDGARPAAIGLCGPWETPELAENAARRLL